MGTDTHVVCLFFSSYFNQNWNLRRNVSTDTNFDGGWGALSRSVV